MIAALLLAAAAAAAQPPQPMTPAVPTPDHANIRYGPHERNVLDLWFARSARPTPLVIYYHGGGFRGGDKRTIPVQLLSGLVKSGVTVAGANYRLSDAAPYPAQMRDAARALQFLRLNAAKYNLDPQRVGACGGSAGAGISLWLAFHDDLADPRNPDPLFRQPTRIRAAVVWAAQSSYDPRFIAKLFDTDQVHPALISFFGMKGPEDVANPRFHPLFEDASPINHVRRGGPPVLLYYPQSSEPLPRNSSGNEHIHHPKFGFVLKEKLDRLGIECVVMLREQDPTPPFERYVTFFLEKLGRKGKP